MPAVPFADLARLHAPVAEELSTTFNRVLGSSAFILGEEVERFEAEFAAYCGTRHCVGVASGTAALTIMLQAAGVAPGDEVIVPAHTFVATALAVMHAGATPVCVDVDRRSGLIDPGAVAEAVGPATAAVLAVHLYGQACAVEPLRALAQAARPAPARGRRPGPRGDLPRCSGRQPWARRRIQLLPEQEPRCAWRRRCDLHQR